MLLDDERQIDNYGRANNKTKVGRAVVHAHGRAVVVAVDADACAELDQSIKIINRSTYKGTLSSLRHMAVTKSGNRRVVDGVT